jgi:hypothetical protein
MNYPPLQTSPDHWDCRGELGPTWLCDARRLARYVLIVVCEMPAGRLLEAAIREGSPASGVISVLTRFGVRCGYPTRLFLPNSAEFHSHDVQAQCAMAQVAIEYLPRVRASAVTEHFFRKLRADIEALGPKPAIHDCRRVAGAL